MDNRELMENTILEFVIEFHIKYNGTMNKFTEEWGKKMFVLSTSHGLPIEDIITMLNDKYDREMVTMMYIYYTGFKTSHDIVSGLGEKRMGKLQQNNIKKTYKMITTGSID